MYNTHQDLIDAYRAVPAVVEVILQGYTPDQARLGAGTPGDWSVIEIICHMRDAEERALERMRMMRDRLNPLLPGYDQEKWVQERNYAQADLTEALAAFVRFVKQHIDELQSLTTQQWERTGQHEEMGQISILTQTIHMVSHQLIHMAQLAGKRKVTPV